MDEPREVLEVGLPGETEEFGTAAEPFQTEFAAGIGAPVTLRVIGLTSLGVSDGMKAKHEVIRQSCQTSAIQGCSFDALPSDCSLPMVCPAYLCIRTACRRERPQKMPPAASGRGDPSSSDSSRSGKLVGLRLWLVEAVVHIRRTKCPRSASRILRGVVWAW